MLPIEIIPYTKTNGPDSKAREDMFRIPNIPHTDTNTNDLNESWDRDAQHFPEHSSGAEFGADGEDVFLIEIIPYTKTNGPNGKAREDIPYTVTNTNDLNELMDWDAQHFPEHLSGTGFYILVFYVNFIM